MSAAALFLVSLCQVVSILLILTVPIKSWLASLGSLWLPFSYPNIKDYVFDVMLCAVTSDVVSSYCFVKQYIRI